MPIVSKWRLRFGAKCAKYPYALCRYITILSFHYALYPRWLGWQGQQPNIEKVVGFFFLPSKHLKRNSISSMTPEQSWRAGLPLHFRVFF